MTRAMFTQLTHAGDSDEVTGVLFTQLADEESGLDEHQFWVSRDEARDVIHMLCDAFDWDAEVHES